jgi:hypothetical protein
MNIEDFDVEFASVADYAQLYRELGLQAVPAMSPGRDASKAWKRPALKDWRTHQNNLVDDDKFAEWFPPDYAGNIGVLTGACSGNVFVVDLDLQKGPEAALWWSEMDHRQEHAGELETVSQRTGGGGQQLFYRAPDGWIPPTGKNGELHVDIRGAGGFVMIAPSMHESGQRYEWLEGFEPWVVEIAEAPRWLCEEIERLFGQGHVENAPAGSTEARGPIQRTETPSSALHPLGGILDGRETFMARMIWAKVVDLYRTCPIKPSEGELASIKAQLFLEYDLHCHTRLPADGRSNASRLEEEGRGFSLFTEKWGSALSQWDGKVAKHAADAPKVDVRQKELEAEFEAADIPRPFAKTAELPDVFMAEDDDTFEVLSIDDIMNLPDPKWLVQDVMMTSSFAIMFGAPGCGKSFMAIDLSLSIAAGLAKWMGHDILEHGPVLYISSEGEADIKFRIKAWAQERGVDLKKVPFRLIRRNLNFMNPGDVAKLAKTVQKAIAKNGAPFKMVVVDTISRVIPGADENLQKDMTLFIQACDLIRQAFGCMVLGVHHTSKGGDMRGSSAFKGAADTILQLTRTEDDEPGCGTMFAAKIKAARDQWAHPFHLKEVIIAGTGIPGKTTLVSERLAETPVEAAGASFGGGQETGGNIVDGHRWPSKDVCQTILNEMRGAWVSGKPWSSKIQTKSEGRYAPMIMHAKHGITIETAKRMVDHWLANDILSYEIVSAHTKLHGLKVVGSIS